MTPRTDRSDEIAEESLILVTLPEVYLRLREVMDTEESTVNDIADVIALDPSLAARLLRIANSAFFGLPSTVETVSRAVKILGTQQIYNLVLATGVCHSFQGLPNDLMDMGTFWRRSLLCGYFSRGLMRLTGSREGEAMFVRGLLHDIGHLVLYNRYSDECRQALEAAYRNEGNLDELERRLIGCDAAQVSAAMLRIWRLPAAFSETIEYQNRPADAPEHARTAAVIHIASRLLPDEREGKRPAHSVLGPTREDAWELTGLSEQNAERIVDEASTDVVEAMYRLFAP